jgi:hypothetical protein
MLLSSVELYIFAHSVITMHRIIYLNYQSRGLACAAAATIVIGSHERCTPEFNVIIFGTSIIKKKRQDKVER